MCAGLAGCGVSVSPCEWDRIEKAVLEDDWVTGVDDEDMCGDSLTVGQCTYRYQCAPHCLVPCWA